ncbi:MAG: hypothetical protein PVG78_03150 [Desulfobacterales bacterium]|jgi:hypothetical protein
MESLSEAAGEGEIPVEGPNAQGFPIGTGMHRRGLRTISLQGKHPILPPGRGSLYELIDHVLVAEACDYIDADLQEHLVFEIKAAIRLLNGYIKYLRARTNKEPSYSPSTI